MQLKQVTYDHHPQLLEADFLQLIDKIRHSTNLIAELPDGPRQAAVDSYADALKVVFICQAVANFFAFLSCLAIQENPLSCVRLLRLFVFFLLTVLLM